MQILVSLKRLSEEDDNKGIECNLKRDRRIINKFNKKSQSYNILLDLRENKKFWRSKIIRKNNNSKNELIL